jgi:hypothetical protein
VSGDVCREEGVVLDEGAVECCALHTHMVRLEWRSRGVKEGRRVWEDVPDIDRQVDRSGYRGAFSIIGGCPLGRGG